jgi:hypothetical protein
MIFRALTASRGATVAGNALRKELHVPNPNEPSLRRDKDLAAQAHTDDPRQAIESGEPRIAGHQGTHIIDDEADEGADKSNPDQQRDER